MKRKGFTLVELLVVISIIALLMSILMPALAKVRSLAQRVVCGAHLSGIGKQLVIYSNDFEQKYPRAGGKESKWGATANWQATTNALPSAGEAVAYGASPSNNYATIGACLFYLIKYADASPKVFNCGSDIGARIFQLSDYTNNVLNNNIAEAWDFGPTDIGGSTNAPRLYYSYAYQYPFAQIGKTGGYFPLNTLMDSGVAIMADSSPYLALTFDSTWGYFKKKGTGRCRCGTEEKERFGNSPNHKGDGQNILFADCSVTWSDTPASGFESDNIYTMASPCVPGFTGTQDVGTIYTPSTPSGTSKNRCFSDVNFYPVTKVDSILINEGIDQGGIDPTGNC